MSKARDIIEEIAEIRKRRLFGSAMAELPFRLMSLEQAFQDNKGRESELIRYFPVALIACMEGYFRMVIKDLIDSGEPFLSNADRPTLKVNLDFSVLRAVHGKTITVGELVAHSVQLSRLEHVETALSNILGSGFLKSLETTTDRWAHEIKGEEPIPILANPNGVFADVARTFQLRHIICHEIASAYEIKFDEVARCFESCVAFLKASDEFISETLYPGAPLTQTDMNIAAGEALNDKYAELNVAAERLLSRLDEAESAAFNDSHEKWQQYCDAWAGFVAGNREGGGTIWPMIFAGAAKETVGMRIQEIREFRRLSDSAENTDE